RSIQKNRIGGNSRFNDRVANPVINKSVNLLGADNIQSNNKCEPEIFHCNKMKRHDGGHWKNAGRRNEIVMSKLQIGGSNPVTTDVRTIEPRPRWCAKRQIYRRRSGFNRCDTQFNPKNQQSVSSLS